MTDDFCRAGCTEEAAQDLAAADAAELTRVTQERDSARAELSTVRAELERRIRLGLDRESRLVTLHAEVNQWRERWQKAMDDSDQLTGRALAAEAELERLRPRVAELEQLVARAFIGRQTIVARDGGRNCTDCEREIRRGEAYELVPGDDPDALRHLFCPDPAGGGA